MTGAEPAIAGEIVNPDGAGTGRGGVWPEAIWEQTTTRIPSRVK